MLPLLLAAVTLTPLHGVPLTGPTHLRLLVAAKPPFVYDVDRHRVIRARGIPRPRGPLWIEATANGPVAVADTLCARCRHRQMAYRVSPDGAARELTTVPRQAIAALAGGTAVTQAGHGFTLTRHDGTRTSLRWPSVLGSFDQVAAAPHGPLALLTFADPAWNGGPTQAQDAWLLNTSTGKLSHVPGFPALVDLKFSELQWLPDGRLAYLARGGHGTLGLWRPGQPAFALRRVRLPAEDSGSDSFAAF
jgi:hypothetical protein